MVKFAIILQINHRYSNGNDDRSLPAFLKLSLTCAFNSKSINIFHCFDARAEIGLENIQHPLQYFRFNRSATRSTWRINRRCNIPRESLRDVLKAVVTDYKTVKGNAARIYK